MTRMYIQPSFVDSCSDHGEWSGGNGQYRGDRSVEVVPTYINGRPNVRAFSDEAIEARRAKKKTSIPLVDRVLPQQRRVRVLTEQLYELEAERKNGLDIKTYSQLRDVLIVKRGRAEVLLQKALSVRPIRSETDEDSAQVQAEYTHSSGFSPSPNDGHASEEFEEIGVIWIDQLSNGNSFKKILQKGCKGVRTLVRWHQASKRYIQALKEV